MRDHILITRPHDDAVRTAEMVKASGLIPFIEPMLKVGTFSDIDLPQDLSAYQGLVFTSVNAVRAVSSLIESHDLTAYAVGKRTAEEAKKAGWKNLRIAKGHSRDLSALLAEEEDREGKPFLHLSGRHIVKPLKAGYHQIERRVVYEARKVVSLSEECLSLLDKGEFTAALFYSARTAENFETLVQQYGRSECLSSIKALCIGERVVKSLRKEKWQDVHHARTPDGNGMKNLLQDVCGM